ncbi:DUF5686 family protein [Aquirufa sp. HETE-83D]|uniref:DUF5686 family protein n=1 Tax=Aquirufa esocilacus TaxID=3096513 RepID=A0ABW6DG92_9BACT
MIGCFIHFSPNESQAQSLTPASILDKALSSSEEHGKSIGSFKMRVKVQEKARFNQVIGIARKRLVAKEGIQMGQWYGNQTISEVQVGHLNQLIHGIESVQTFHKKYSKPTLFLWPDFYQDYVGTSCVSPLSYQAKSYYHFNFKGDTLVEGKACFQFQVEPKIRRDRLFKGTLTLDEAGWLVRFDGTVFADAIDYSFDLQNQNFQGKWIPKKGEIRLLAGLLGSDGEYIWEQEAISQPEEWRFNPQIFDEPKNPKETLNISPVAFDETFANQFLTNLHGSLLRKWKQRPTSNLVMIDSVYYKGSENKAGLDPTFFTDIPGMKNTEVLIDSFKVSPFHPKQLILSKSFYFGEFKRDYYPFEIYYKSPVFDSNFNTVEGFVVNSAVVFRKRWARYQLLEAEVLGRRAFGINRNSGLLRLRYRSDSFDATVANGDYVAQYNPENTISPEMNSLSTLLLKNNQMKIYRTKFTSVNLTKRFSARFFLKSLVEYSERSQMDNTTDYYWINFLNRDFKPNNPTNSEYTLEGFTTHKSFITQIQVGFRPFLTQSYRANTRLTDWGSSPLLLAKYRAGWKDVGGSSTDFNQVELSYLHNIEVNPWIKMGLLINAGTFIGNKPTYFIDFKHYNGTLNLIQAGEMLASERLVGYYQNFTSGTNQRLNVNHYANSTAGTYVEALSFFQFSNLWLKPLLGMKKLYVKEVLIANANYVQNQNLLYNEVGYGLDGVFKIFRLEAIANFINGQFSYIGFRVNINSRIRIGNIPE